MSLQTDTTQAAAIEQCAREPIHIPGSIQPHGAVVVLHPETLHVLQASANAAATLGAPVTTGQPLPSAIADDLRPWVGGIDTQLQRWLRQADRGWQVTAQRSSQGLVLSFEPASEMEAHALDRLYPRLQRFIDSIEGRADVAELGALAAAEVRDLTGFDRVMIYRFDAEWNGTVVAESGNGRLPSYLDLRFPASDIPAQARELYRRSRLRLIPDARYEPVPIEPLRSPVDGQPLDMSFVALRSVSPVHLQYMRNMGTDASMSISILVDGALWGLVSCHHAEPRVLGPQMRAACDFLGQMLSLQIGARERHAEATRRLDSKNIESELLARMARSASIHAGLSEHPEAWMRLGRAQGAAVLTEGTVITVGRTPSVEQMTALAGWLHQNHGKEAVWETRELPSLYPPAGAFTEVGCGVLAASISALHPHYLLWFRPELIHTVRWGGEPVKAADPADGALRPRRSFALWTERVRGLSERFEAIEVEAAESFRNSVVNFVLKRAEERAALTEKLQTSNKELEAFSYSVSHDLRAPFRHIVGFAQLLGETESSLADRSRHYLDTIVDAALSAGRLVDDLLSFSQLGRASLDLHKVDMNKLVAEVRQSVKPDEGERRVEWTVGELPPAWGDGSLIRQIVANLIDNALKYSRDKAVSKIEIGGEQRAHETVYFVADNGVGFDMAYVGKLFGVFQRLHRVEDFEGSGIGLALARRIVDRHGGWITAEGKLGHGATFRFALPKP